MPQKSTFTLFTLRGIRIGVDWSWFVVLALIIWLLTNRFQVMLGAAPGDTGPYVLAVISALLFFASILLHELGHSWVAR
jgi:Zn-dependent protease